MGLKKHRAWYYFASYIKKRDKGICFTCGNRASGRAYHAGHFIQAFGNQNVFFDETNVHGQCAKCNLWLSGNLGIYSMKLREKYGESHDKELLKKSRKTKQFSEKDLQEIKEIYKKKLKKYE